MAKKYENDKGGDRCLRRGRVHTDMTISFKWRGRAHTDVIISLAEGPMCVLDGRNLSGIGLTKGPLRPRWAAWCWFQEPEESCLVSGCTNTIVSIA